MPATRLTVVLLLLAGLAGLGGAAAAAQSEPVPVGTEVGLQAPDFYLPLVGSDPLEKVHLYDYVGHYDVVLLYIFSAAS